MEVPSNGGASGEGGAGRGSYYSDRLQMTIRAPRKIPVCLKIEPVEAGFQPAHGFAQGTSERDFDLAQKSSINKVDSINKKHCFPYLLLLLRAMAPTDFLGKLPVPQFCQALYFFRAQIPLCGTPSQCVEKMP